MMPQYLAWTNSIIDRPHCRWRRACYAWYLDLRPCAEAINLAEERRKSNILHEALQICTQFGVIISQLALKAFDRQLSTP